MVATKEVIDSNLLSILQAIQEEFGYLPGEKIQETAQSLNIPLSEVYGVVTFYKSFSLTPRGRHVITTCLGTACHIRGSPRVLKTICEILGIEPDETTEDNEFTVETVNCLGCCALGPMVVVDGHYHGLMNSAKVRSLLQYYKDQSKTKEEVEAVE